jgi:hypothetical protein
MARITGRGEGGLSPSGCRFLGEILQVAEIAERLA